MATSHALPGSRRAEGCATASVVEPATTVRSGAKMLPASESLCEAAGIRAGLTRPRRRDGDRQRRARCSSSRLRGRRGRLLSQHSWTLHAPVRPPRGSTPTSSRATPSNLAFPDASFDAVLSVFGAMFAPDQHRAARELLRVCRPGRDDRDGELDACARIVLRHRRHIRAAAGWDRLAAGLGDTRGIG